jgi:anti-anti-sigma factor
MDIATDYADGAATLVLHGDFDVRSTWEVRNAIYEHLEGHDEDVVVDMSGVDAIDLTALRLLAVATRRASRAGHHLTLRGCGPAVRRMLHLTRLAHAVDVERTAATA